MTMDVAALVFYVYCAMFITWFLKGCGIFLMRLVTDHPARFTRSTRLLLAFLLIALGLFLHSVSVQVMWTGEGDVTQTWSLLSVVAVLSACAFCLHLPTVLSSFAFMAKCSYALQWGILACYSCFSLAVCWAVHSADPPSIPLHAPPSSEMTDYALATAFQKMQWLRPGWLVLLVWMYSLVHHKLRALWRLKNYRYACGYVEVIMFAGRNSERHLALALHCEAMGVESDSAVQSAIERGEDVASQFNPMQLVQDTMYLSFYPRRGGVNSSPGQLKGRVYDFKDPHIHTTIQRIDGVNIDIVKTATWMSQFRDQVLHDPAHMQWHYVARNCSTVCDEALRAGFASRWYEVWKWQLLTGHIHTPLSVLLFARTINSIPFVAASVLSVAIGAWIFFITAIGVNLAHTVVDWMLSCPADRVFILTDWSCPSILNLGQCTFTQACVQIGDYRIANAFFIAAKAPLTSR